MAVECCNDERDTRFCPDCGKELDPFHTVAMRVFILSRMEREAELASKNTNAAVRKSHAHKQEMYRAVLEKLT